MANMLWVLALCGAVQADSPVADPASVEPVPAAVTAAPVAPVRAVQSHAAGLQEAALTWARTQAAAAHDAGRDDLTELASLLVAGPDLATRDAGTGIAALCAWSDATGDAGALAVAVATAEWALSDRRLQGSGFSHHGDPTAPAALADSVLMGHALLALHASTGEPDWLAEAQATAGFVGSRFLSGGRGFASIAVLDTDRTVLRSENGDTVAFVAWLGHVTGEPRWSGMARHGLAWLRSAPDHDGETAAAARAVDERPTHVVVVGPRDDGETRALFDAARALPLEHRWLEWRDPQVWLNSPSAVPVPLEGPATAWLCDGVDCGEPLRTPAEVAGLRLTLEDSPVAQGDAATD